MPWNDWQFWAVSALAGGAVIAILRQAGVLPTRRGRSRSGGERRVRLTIEGERPERDRGG